MRLVCPNCEAKYEVPEDAIPETGRDVQCANCGHAWFQMRQRAAGAAPVVAPVVAPVEPPPPAPVAAPAPAAVPAPEPVPEVPAAPVAEAVVDSPEAAVPVEAPIEPPAPAPAAEVPVEPAAEAAPVADPVPEVVETAAAAAEQGDVGPVAEAAPAAEAASEPVAAVSDAPADTEAEDGEAEAPASAGAIAAAGVAAYAVDESVLAILREEAEREAQARKAEAEKLETQTELGIDSSAAAAKSPAIVDPVSGDGMADSAAGRRTRLPDVEEINSTLRPAEVAEAEAGPDAQMEVAESGSSFRSGFLLVMTIAILGSALYASAESISGLVPALAGPLKAYVGFVDSLRLQLDGLMQSATVAINGN